MWMGACQTGMPDENVREPMTEVSMSPYLQFIVEETFRANIGL